MDLRVVHPYHQKYSSYRAPSRSWRVKPGVKSCQFLLFQSTHGQESREVSLIRSDGAHVGNDEVQRFSMEFAAMVGAYGCSERDLNTILSCRQSISVRLSMLIQIWAATF